MPAAPERAPEPAPAQTVGTYALSWIKAQTYESATKDLARITNYLVPSELGRMGRAAGLSVEEIIGMTYNPITKIYALGPDTDVNYIMALRA